MFEKVFKGDKTKYDPDKSTFQITGVPLSEDDLAKYGINLNEIKFNTNSTVRQATPSAATRYTIVPDNSSNAGKPGYITKSEYNYLVATIAGEAGGVSTTNSYAVVSASLNAAEKQYDGDIMEFLENNCWPYGKNYKDYIGADGEICITGAEQEKNYERAKISTDVALSGTRAFPSEVQFWVGNWKHLNDNGLLNKYNSFNKFSTTSEESSQFVE